MTEEFFEALHVGDISTIEELVNESPSLVNALNADNISPFEFALNAGFSKLADYLINQRRNNTKKSLEGGLLLLWLFSPRRWLSRLTISSNNSRVVRTG